MRKIMILALAGAMVLIGASSASAWTPQDCADFYEEHGYNHADCQDYVPPPPPPELVPVCRDGVDVLLPRDSVPIGGEGTCAEIAPPPETPAPQPVPPPAPVETPVPPTQPVVEDQPPIKDHAIPPPVQVKGKEQGPPKKEKLVPPSKPVLEAREQVTGTLPFTGFSVIPTLVVGAFLLLGGLAGRRILNH